MIDLIIICSVTIQECFDSHLKVTLKKIGVPYKLILTDPILPISESYNSILQTNLDDVEKSKYLIFMAQDITINGQDWGQKIISICDSLPDFGYGGVECRLDKQHIGYFTHGKTNEPAIEVTTCDEAFNIIPSKLFLEHQFDTQFKWYPFMTDYQCWIRFVKKLKVYHVPVEGYWCGGCGASRWVSQFKTNREYAAKLAEDHARLLNKWGLAVLRTTTWG